MTLLHIIPFVFVCCGYVFLVAATMTTNKPVSNQVQQKKDRISELTEKPIPTITTTQEISTVTINNTDDDDEDNDDRKLRTAFREYFQSHVPSGLLANCVIYISDLTNAKSRPKRYDRENSEEMLTIVRFIDKDIHNGKSSYNSSLEIFHQITNSENANNKVVQNSFDSFCLNQQQRAEEKANQIACSHYRYSGCFADQPFVEKVSIVLEKTSCHTLNILSFGIGYFFRSC
nr:hypothetical protein [Microctonus hyperodae filamentous virus]